MSDENTALPWDSDLESAFEDEDQRTAVSEFLKENVQPYVTKIETEARPNRDATQLWEAYNSEPESTSVQVVRELYGDEVADKFVAILAGKAPEEQTAEEPAKEEPSSTTEEEPAKEGIKFDDLPVEVREVIASQQQEKAKEQYDAQIDQAIEAHAEKLPKDAEGKVVFDKNLFHPFVVMNEGNIDAAFENYLQYQDQTKEAFGLKPEGTPPPNTIDSQTRDASATPPQEKTYGSLDEAMDAFFDEQKSPPPTVGAV